MMNLENIKEGDEVVLHEGYSYGHSSIAKVDKVGKIHITVNGDKFRKNGVIAGDTWCRKTIRAIRDEDDKQKVLDESSRRKFLEIIKSRNWDYFDLYTLQKIHQLTEEFITNKKGKTL